MEDLMEAPAPERIRAKAVLSADGSLAIPLHAIGVSESGIPVGAVDPGGSAAKQ